MFRTAFWFSRGAVHINNHQRYRKDIAYGIIHSYVLFISDFYDLRFNTSQQIEIIHIAPTYNTTYTMLKNLHLIYQ